jgi:hypothetical protein
LDDPDVEVATPLIPPLIFLVFVLVDAYHWNLNLNLTVETVLYLLISPNILVTASSAAFLLAITLANLP